MISSDFAQGFGWLAIVVPVVLLKLLSLLCFAVANGYFAFILYLEYKKDIKSLPLLIVDKTEQIFDKLIKNNLKNVVFILSILSFIFNIFISVINFYIILIGFITFGILLLIKKRSGII